MNKDWGLGTIRFVYRSALFAIREYLLFSFLNVSVVILCSLLVICNTMLIKLSKYYWKLHVKHVPNFAIFTKNPKIVMGLIKWNVPLNESIRGWQLLIRDSTTKTPLKLTKITKLLKLLISGLNMKI